MKVVLPGQVIGFLGGGQLARMMAFEARRMGYRIAVLDPDPKGPAGQVADVVVTGSFDDGDAAERLCAASDVVTLDTEHIPADLLARLEARHCVLPGAAVIGVIQDRLAQRKFLTAQKVPQPANAAAGDLAELRAAVATVGLPCVVKARRNGYDGKGQARITTTDGIEAAWRTIGGAPAVVEAFVDFEREVSVLLARGRDGEVRFFASAANEHRRHVLHVTRAPAGLTPSQEAEAQAIGRAVAEGLGHVGVLAVELFVTRSGGLLVNEVAPRVHNSGHYTFGACATSQFEQHVRAVCGLPLGDPELLRPAAMVNLLGDLWGEGEPAWHEVLRHPCARLHLYGKGKAMPGRKMGHVLLVGDGVEPAVAAIAAWMEQAAAKVGRAL
ncbi:MAG: 5-(carboxyamino)imidazole ribonucleotide synthase [Phycisphaerales bacterium]|nr:5-(carboxyamino)imidazole ribonucleotide synthase [Phycisphaerales bacterium]